jgi:hypothetical protein
MIVPAEFWRTTGKDRFEAVLLRYEQQQLSAKTSAEYLAELLPESAVLSKWQQRLVEGAHHLVHDLSDGIMVEDHEFEALLAQR